MYDNYEYDQEHDQEHDRYDCHDYDIIGYPIEYILGDDFYISEDDMDERWLPIQEYFGRYWISDHGNVWDMKKKRYVREERGNQYGHRSVELRDEYGRRKHHYIHILVADAFIPGKFEGAQVLHNIPDPEDNYARNLHWGTQLENVRECIEQGRFRYFTREDIEAANEKRSRPLRAKNVKTGVVLDFPSQCEAARKLGISQSAIGDVISGRCTHIKKWTFADVNAEFPDLTDVNLNYYRKKPWIIATDVETGEEIKFQGLTRAAEKLGMSISSISMVLSGKMRSAKGWTFEYLDEEEYDE